MTRNKYVWLLAVVLFVFWFAYEVRAALTPFLVSILLAYLFNPLINHFKAQGYRKWVIISILFVIGALLIAELAIYLVPRFFAELAMMKTTLPAITGQVKAFLVNAQLSLEKIYPPLHSKSLPDLVAAKLTELAKTLPEHVPGILGNFFSWLYLMVLIPFITFALLLDSDRLADWIFSIFPSRYTETVLSIMSEINQVMHDFLQGQVMRLLWLTFITTLGLVYLKVNFALLFGLLAGVFNIIPVLGAWLGAIPPILLVLITGNVVLAVKLAILFIGVQVLDNTIVSTYYLSTSVNLHFVLVLFAIMVGAELYGLMGVILSVPVFSMVKAVVQILYHDYRHKMLTQEG